MYNYNVFKLARGLIETLHAEGLVTSRHFKALGYRWVIKGTWDGDRLIELDDVEVVCLADTHYPTVLVLGHARHGKDTVADFLLKLTESSYASSSEVAIQLLEEQIVERLRLTDNELYYQFKEFFVTSGLPRWRAIMDFRYQKGMREILFDAIREFTKDDPSRLAVEVFASGSAIYVGMRSKVEFEASRGLFDYVLGVIRPFMAAEPTMQIDVQRESDCVLLNDSDLDELARQVYEFAKTAYAPYVEFVGENDGYSF